MKTFTAENIASLIVELTAIAKAQDGKGNPLVGQVCAESAEALLSFLSAALVLATERSAK